MLTKTATDEIQSFLHDSSHMQPGNAERVAFPESAEDVAEVLATATREHTPVTVSGAGTGTVGGRVPFGGIVLATDKLNRIKSIVERDGVGGHAVAEVGVILRDLQQSVDSEGLLYPPDPTERRLLSGWQRCHQRLGRAHFQIWTNAKLRAAAEDCFSDWRVDRSATW